MCENKRLNIEQESKYSWLLVFLFLCGSMLSLIYMPESVARKGLSLRSYALSLAILLLLLSLLSTSVCGRFLMPLCFIVFGVLTAMNAGAACGELQLHKTLFMRRVALGAVFTPVCFALGVRGMSNSRAIFASLTAEGSLGKKHFAAMYSVMAVTAAVSTLLVYVVLK